MALVLQVYTARFVNRLFYNSSVASSSSEEMYKPQNLNVLNIGVFYLGDTRISVTITVMLALDTYMFLF